MRKKQIVIPGIIVLIIFVLIIIPIIWYNVEKKAPNKSATEEDQIIVNIESGTSTTNILELLKQNDVIKNKFAAKIYIVLNDITGLQAGKYEFTGAENLEEVLEKITSGDVMDESITITFKEGKNMRYIAQTIAEYTNNTANDVYEVLQDEEYIESLIKEYWFLTDEILDENIYYSLEGYLYPETYIFENDDISVETIFEKMLDQTKTVLADYRQTIRLSRYSTHEILTMASIVELEATNAEDRAKVARVIYNRLDSNMSLGSDVTTYYSIKVDVGERDLYTKEINNENAYNTRGPNMEGKLPIGPIDNPSLEAIEAVLNPAEGDYLYFVADKNGDMYFSETYDEHQELIATLKKKGLWYDYDE